jgi:two-component system response regulator ResD
LARILVVDDEGDIRALSGRVLVSVGHTVDLAKDGNEAMEWLNDYDYDLVVLDVMMPNKNGLEVLQDMKNSDRLRDVPVIIFSALGSGSQGMVEEGNRADDYLEKPFTRNEFLRKVEKILGKAK